MDNEYKVRALERAKILIKEKDVGLCLAISSNCKLKGMSYGIHQIYEYFDLLRFCPKHKFKEVDGKLIPKTEYWWEVKDKQIRFNVIDQLIKQFSNVQNT